MSSHGSGTNGRESSEERVRGVSTAATVRPTPPRRTDVPALNNFATPPRNVWFEVAEPSDASEPSKSGLDAPDRQVPDDRATEASRFYKQLLGLRLRLSAYHKTYDRAVARFGILEKDYCAEVMKPKGQSLFYSAQRRRERMDTARYEAFKEAKDTFSRFGNEAWWKHKTCAEALRGSLGVEAWNLESNSTLQRFDRLDEKMRDFAEALWGLRPSKISMWANEDREDARNDLLDVVRAMTRVHQTTLSSDNGAAASHPCDCACLILLTKDLAMRALEEYNHVVHVTDGTPAAHDHAKKTFDLVNASLSLHDSCRENSHHKPNDDYHLAPEEPDGFQRQMTKNKDVGFNFHKDHLDSGGEAEVYRAYHYKRKCHVALKSIRRKNTTDVTLSRDSLVTETRVLHLMGLNHANIIKCYGYLQKDLENKPKPCVLILELARCSLDTYLKCLPDREPKLRPLCATNYFHQVASAISHLHRHRVAHRDLKPQNVLVVPDDPAYLKDHREKGDDAAVPATHAVTLKLTDFGQAKQREVLTGKFHHSVNEVAGTVLYMAPELGRVFLQQPMAQKASRNCYFKADSFSFGCVGYQILCGFEPWHLEKNDARQKNSQWNELTALTAAAQGQRPQIPEYLRSNGQYEHLVRLVETCWSAPEQRPLLRTGKIEYDLFHQKEQLCKESKGNNPRRRPISPPLTWRRPTSATNRTVFRMSLSTNQTRLLVHELERQGLTT